MRKLSATLIGILMAASLSIGSTRSSTPRGSPQTASNYPESEDGFRAELKAVVHADCAGDTSAGKRLLEQFKLPDSAAWFAKNFDPGEAPKLAERYDRLFAAYAGSMEKTITDVCNAKGPEIAIRHADTPEEPKHPRADFKFSAIRPRQDLAIARFEFSIQLKGQEQSSWEETFAHDNGAFRFIGLGAWPFWSLEEEADSHVFKNGHFTRRLVLVHQVSPNYPIAARAQRVEGIVVLRTSVDKEGKVKSVKVVRGDPMLVDAAMEAVKQWRFTPASIGGIPFEDETVVSVAFQLPNR